MSCLDFCLCVCRWETDGGMSPIPACYSVAAKRVFRLRLESVPKNTVQRYCTSFALLLEFIAVKSYMAYNLVLLHFPPATELFYHESRC